MCVCVYGGSLRPGNVLKLMEDERLNVKRSGKGRSLVASTVFVSFNQLIQNSN